jgi:hypothetical protein
MALVRGRYKDVEIAEDGSSVKVRTVNGAAIRLDVDNLSVLISDLINSLVAANMNSTVSETGASATRYEPAPPVVNASDVNVNHHPETDVFVVQATTTKDGELSPPSKPATFVFSGTCTSRRERRHRGTKHIELHGAPTA